MTVYHYWNVETASPDPLKRWDDLCGRDNTDKEGHDYSSDWEVVNCEECKSMRGTATVEAVAALKSYSKLTVLAERERICKLLEEMIAEIRRES